MTFVSICFHPDICPQKQSVYKVCKIACLDYKIHIDFFVYLFTDDFNNPIIEQKKGMNTKTKNKTLIPMPPDP